MRTALLTAVMPSLGIMTSTPVLQKWKVGGLAVPFLSIGNGMSSNSELSRWS